MQRGIQRIIAWPGAVTTIFTRQPYRAAFCSTSGSALSLLCPVAAQSVRLQALCQTLRLLPADICSKHSLPAPRYPPLLCAASSDQRSPSAILQRCLQLTDQLHMHDLYDAPMHALACGLEGRHLTANPTEAEVAAGIQALTREKVCIELVKGRFDSPSGAASVPFDVALFTLPPHTQLSPHSHPGMVVLSRVLHGAMKVQSFQPIDSGPAAVAGLCIETSMDCSVDSPTWYLTPSHGNVHKFSTQDTPCVLLDVILPPYDDEAGRPCRFYESNEVDQVHEDGSRQVHLREMEPPWQELPYPLNYPTQWCT